MIGLESVQLSATWKTRAEALLLGERQKDMTRAAMHNPGLAPLLSEALRRQLAKRKWGLWENDTKEFSVLRLHFSCSVKLCGNKILKITLSQAQGNVGVSDTLWANPQLPVFLLSLCFGFIFLSAQWCTGKYIYYIFPAFSVVFSETYRVPSPQCCRKL